MRIWKYNIKNVTKEYKTEKLGISFNHKYWYLWNIFIDFFWFHLYIEICRTDWNLGYKRKCPRYSKKCKHNIECNGKEKNCIFR